MSRPLYSVTAADTSTALRELGWIRMFPCAAALLRAWSMPWAGVVQRYAMHEILRAWNAGIDVMEPRLRYTSADALMAVWTGDRTPRAYGQATRVLETVARLTGQEAETLVP